MSMFYILYFIIWLDYYQSFNTVVGVSGYDAAM